MSKFIIEGGNALNGEITVAGNKNAALPIIAATVLTDEPCIIENLPIIRDVQAMLAILDDLGKTITQLSPHSYQISNSINKTQLNKELSGSLRASILYLGALLASSGKVVMSPPGGCVIGRRNIDCHLEVISAMGAKFKIEDRLYSAELTKLKPARIFLKEASVTATENAMLLAAVTSGETIIENAACEPHVADLADVLGKMGATVIGGGTNQIHIKGQKKLSGFHHRVMPDHIEAGTFAIAAACTQGKMIIHDACKKHLYMTIYYLKNMGVELKFLNENTLSVSPSKLVPNIKIIKVGVWPGFPTDLMSPMIVLATQAEGTTLCHDWMYESRMFFVDKLIAMGAQITQCDPHRVLVTGPTKLKGKTLSSPDIRAGIALVIAALSATGTGEIDRVELIDKGYENIVLRLNKVGAEIQKVND